MLHAFSKLSSVREGTAQAIIITGILKAPMTKMMKQSSTWDMFVGIKIIIFHCAGAAFRAEVSITKLEGRETSLTQWLFKKPVGEQRAGADSVPFYP